MSLLEFVKHFQVTGWGWYWLVWAVIGFGVPEAYGLFVNAQDTLSWQFWGIERIDFKHPFDFAEWTWAHWVIACVFNAFIIWLDGHIVWGIWH